MNEGYALLNDAYVKETVGRHRWLRWASRALDATTHARR
jgi:hypothetical protein